MDRQYGISKLVDKQKAIETWLFIGKITLGIKPTDKSMVLRITNFSEENNNTMDRHCISTLKKTQ
jgi:hypothetical protein